MKTFIGFLFVFSIFTFFNTYAQDQGSSHNSLVVSDDRDTPLDGDYYIGVFYGSGQTNNKHTDLEGFANWGYPGSSVDYKEAAPIAGVLAGRRININGIPIRIELDGAFGDGLSASTNKLDPVGLDERAETDISWLVTARLGVERDIGPVTVILNGGLAMARVSNSVIDIDFKPGVAPWEDLDDSFHDTSTHTGWVIGVGAEMALDDNWSLRVDGSYIDLGGDIYKVNHSGNNSCGPLGPRRPCSYEIDNEMSIIRLALIRKLW